MRSIKCNAAEEKQAHRGGTGLMAQGFRNNLYFLSAPSLLFFTPMDPVQQELKVLMVRCPYNTVIEQTKKRLFLNHGWDRWVKDHNAPWATLVQNLVFSYVLPYVVKFGEPR